MSRMLTNPALFMVIVLSLALAACGGPADAPAPSAAPEAPAPIATPEPAAPAPAPSPAVTPPAPQPSAAPAPAQVGDGDLIANGNLASWSAGQPDGWILIYPDLVTRSDEPGPSGTTALTLQNPPANTWNTIAAPLLHNTLDGLTVRLELVGRASEPNVLLLALRYRVMNSSEEIVEHVAHSGSGNWERIALVRELPRNVAPGTVQLRAVLRPTATQPAEVDLAVARLVL